MEPYDGRQARCELVGWLINELISLEMMVQTARNTEMSHAKNETVDPSDFDLLKAKLFDLFIEAYKIQNKNRIRQYE